MPIPRPTHYLLAASAAAALGLTLVTPAIAQAATYVPAGGSAYGSSAQVGPVTSGRTSAVSLCTTKAPDTKSSTTAAVNLPGLGRIGAVTTKVSSSTSGGTRSATTTTSTASTTLLGGLVTASAITTKATVSRTSTGAYTTAGSTTLAGLKVAGVAASSTPKANSSITIPGVATVKLNAQSGSSASGDHAFAVTGLQVVLLKDNRLGLPTGTIVVGSSRASLNTAVHHRAYGSAYGTTVDLAGVVRSGQTAAVAQPCGGSNGQTRSNHVAAVSIPGVAKVGAVVSTTRSTDTSTRTTSTSTSTIGAVDLLNGVVTLDGVTTRAEAVRTGTTVTGSSTGTTLTGLKINGKPVAVSAKENTTVRIAGVGTLTLRGVVRSSSKIQVHALQLKLDTAVGGLTTGTVITMGSADAGVSYH